MVEAVKFVYKRVCQIIFMIKPAVSKSKI